jgi:hypothetical protein
VIYLHSRPVPAPESVPAEPQADEPSQPPSKKFNHLTRRALINLSWYNFFKETPSLDKARLAERDDAFIGRWEQRDWWMTDLGKEWLQKLPLADGLPED